MDLVSADTSVESVAPKSTNVDLTIPEQISQAAKKYGVNSREAQAIAFCESTYRHFDRNGQVLRGEVNRSDIGLFQINEYYHLGKSRSLGFDIYTLEGNIEYAMWLLSKQGNQPWHWSRSCWSSKLAAGF